MIFYVNQFGVFEEEKNVEKKLDIMIFSNVWHKENANIANYKYIMANLCLFTNSRTGVSKWQLQNGIMMTADKISKKNTLKYFLNKYLSAVYKSDEKNYDALNVYLARKLYERRIGIRH